MAAAIRRRVGRESSETPIRPPHRNQSEATAMAGLRETSPGLLSLRLFAAAGLGVDAYVHADLAAQFDGNTASISQGSLFRLQAGAAALAALLLVAWGRRVATGLGLLISVSALGAVLLYRYVDVGPLGPLPDMYDPAWYTEKSASAVAEAFAAVCCLALLALLLRRTRRR
jgi:hypothetical protein